MRLRSMLVTVAAMLFGAALALAGAGTATAANPVTAKFGDRLDLVDVGGTLVTGWTVEDLQPSDDPVPHGVNGQLWEATATVTAIRGNIEPIVSNMNARPGGTPPDAAAPWAGGSAIDNYRAIFTVPTAQGINPAVLPQGESRTGKLYFDVTGAPPARVVYNDGVRDVLFWTS